MFGEKARRSGCEDMDVLLAPNTTGSGSETWWQVKRKVQESEKGQQRQHDNMPKHGSTLKEHFS